MRSIPSWLEDSVFYEIYPQSFFDSNGDGIGDIRGIEAKLDYVKSLGCNAVWMNPCFDSPFEDAGYDVRDYYKVAPRYGSNRDLKQLFKKAEKLGIKILLDFVPGHTSRLHPWFIQSAKAKKNKYSNWYIWTDIVWQSAAPLNAVSGYSERDGQYVTNFFWFQPALNYGFLKPDPGKKWQLPTNHPDVLALKKEMTKVMRFWLDMGAAGYRVDMAASLVKNDDEQKSGTSEFWREIRRMLDKDYPEAVIVSEWSEPDQAINAGFHMDFMLHFGPPAYTSLFRAGEKAFFNPAGKGDITVFTDYYTKVLSQTSGKGYISIPSGNHDMMRIAEIGGEDSLKAVFTFLLTMPGIPFIYYGDEIGMRHNNKLLTKEGGYSRTGARTPMQWDARKKNCGFSTGNASELYLPVAKSPDQASVAAQEKRQDSLLNFIRTLINLRRSHPALGAKASFVPVVAEKNRYPFVYKRVLGNKTAVVALNPSSGPSRALLPKDCPRQFKCALNKGVRLAANDGRVELKMDAISYAVLIAE